MPLPPRLHVEEQQGPLRMVRWLADICCCRRRSADSGNISASVDTAAERVAVNKGWRRERSALYHHLTVARRQLANEITCSYCHRTSPHIQLPSMLAATTDRSLVRRTLPLALPLPPTQLHSGRAPSYARAVCAQQQPAASFEPATVAYIGPRCVEYTRCCSVVIKLS